MTHRKNYILHHNPVHTHNCNKLAKPLLCVINALYFLFYFSLKNAAPNPQLLKLILSPSANLHFEKYYIISFNPHHVMDYFLHFDHLSGLAGLSNLSVLI